ncbi:MAG: response regulator [Myxococcales bacterium FL481]|nr:MAG: response regulator [Myxococcales bacterium FL481]
MRAGRILVVDDDPWILRMVCTCLEKQDFIVDRAADGESAVTHALAAPPDLVITDLDLPVLDGWSFATKLRANAALADVPVLFLAAIDKDGARLRELGLTERDYLAKPFRFPELEQRVALALGRPWVEPSRDHQPASRRAGSTTHFGVPALAGKDPEAHLPGVLAWSDAARPGPRIDAARPIGSLGSTAPNPKGSTAIPRPAGRGDSGISGIAGRLEQLGLSSLLVMMELERKGGVLALQHADDAAAGRIFLREGQVVHASLDAAPNVESRQCVYTMLQWQRGRFSFDMLEVEMADTINASTTSLLMEGARRMDESNR